MKMALYPVIVENSEADYIGVKMTVCKLMKIIKPNLYVNKV